MSRASQVYAGIDIGNSKIIVTAGTFTTEKEFVILGSEVAPSEHFEEGEVLNVDKIAASISYAISRLSERYNVKIVDAFMGYSGHIESRQNVCTLDVSERESIGQYELDSLRNQNLVGKREGREILDILITRYTLDDRVVKNPLGYSGCLLRGDFIVISGRTEQLRMLRRVAEKAKLRLHGFVLHQIAAARTLASNDAKEAGVVIVDLGADSTKVAVYYNNALLHVGNIRMGGNIVTNDIKTVKQITFNSAQQIKNTFGVAHVDAVQEDTLIPMGENAHGWGAKQFNLVGLTQIIQARLEMNYDIVANEISKSNCYDNIGYGAILTGGGSFMKASKELFTMRTGMDARVGLPINMDYLGDSHIMAWPYLAVSVGILLEGIDRPFLNPDQRSLFEEDEIAVDERSKSTKNQKQKTKRPEKVKVEGRSLFGGFMQQVGRLFDDESIDTDKDAAI